MSCPVLTLPRPSRVPAGSTQAQGRVASLQFPALFCGWLSPAHDAKPSPMPQCAVPGTGRPLSAPSPIMPPLRQQRAGGDGFKWRCAAGLGSRGLDLHSDALGLRALACACSVLRRCCWLHGCFSSVSLVKPLCRHPPPDHLANLWALRQKPEHTLHMMSIY